MADDDGRDHARAPETGWPEEVFEWRHLVETLPQIVWITRPDGWHTHFNQQWMDFTGLTLEESLGHGWNPPFHPEDRERAAARWADATSTGEPYEIEYRLRRRDGVYRWMLGRAMPLRDEGGRIVRWFGTCTDIDDLKRTQSELEHSRTMHRLAGSMAQLGGWAVDVVADRVIWTDEIYEILEYPAGDPEAPDIDTSYDRFPPEHRARLEEALQACATSGTPLDLELQLQTYRGRWRWVRLLGEPQYAADGSVMQITGALQDITELRESGRQNELLATRLTETLESITDAFYTLDRAWRFTYVNDHAAEVLQRPREELLGRSIWDEFAELRGTEFEPALRRAMRDDSTVTLDDLHYAPLDAWLQVNIYPSPQGLAVYFRDVSEQHRVQAVLRERVKELRGLAAISGAAHAMTDPARLCELTAVSLAASMQHTESVRAKVRLDDVEHEIGGTTDAASRENDSHLEATVTVDGIRRGTLALWDTTGSPFLREEEELLRAVAETLGTWLGRHGAAAALERVNEELNLANAQLASAAQLKDDLLSMASHELRTPLTPILGFAELLTTRGGNLTDDQRRALSSVEKNAKRMLRLVDDLLVVSRAAADVLDSRPERVDAAEAVRSALDDLGPDIDGVEVNLDGCTLVIDPQHLQQIVTNLVTNADKYGALPIAISAAAAGEGRVTLMFHDHGPGVPVAFRQTMWERFAQKDRGNTRTATGAGLGLAIVRLLAEANDGTVGYLDGEPSGAVFTVELPGTLATSEPSAE